MQSYHCIGHALQFLLNPNIVFISSSVNSKSNTCNHFKSCLNSQPKKGAKVTQTEGQSHEKTNCSANYLEILLNALWCDRLGDHDHVSLDVEADQDLSGKEAGFKDVSTISTQNT